MEHSTPTPSRQSARRSSAIPAELSAACVVAVIDTREQHPVDLAPLRVERGTLATGDYSVRGLESVVALERKSLPDLLCCVGQERERFEACVQRLLGYPCRAIIVESSWGELERGEWRSRVTPQAAVGSCLGWIAQGIPIVMAGDHERAGRYIARMLFTIARRRWREARALVNEVMGDARLSPNAPAAETIDAFCLAAGQEDAA